jgi:PAS domain S-box-containing protein
MHPINKKVSALASARPDNAPSSGLADNKDDLIVNHTGTAGKPGKKGPLRTSVLLVDDEPALLDVGKLYLEKIPEMQVTVARSASEALKMITRNSFEVIVSDYQMPEMDGIKFLIAVRAQYPALPFIIFSGKGREDVIIEAINAGVDFYLQKGGDPTSQYAELGHKIRQAVRQRRAEAALKKKHEILQAILAASPYGIAYVRNRTFQWVNSSLAAMLGYEPDQLKGMHLKQLYENETVYEKVGSRIQMELQDKGRSRVLTRFLHRKGFSVDAEIHIAPLDQGNLHFGHMIMMSDISDKLAAAKTLSSSSPLPHLEISPVIEMNKNAEITYYNDAALNALSRYGSRGSLEEFLPTDIYAILNALGDAGDTSYFREVRVGPALFRVHITISSLYQIARLSAVRINVPEETATDGQDQYKKRDYILTRN